MAESSWPTTAGSRVVDDAQYEHLAWGWSRADGILGNTGDTSVVFGDSSGRQVKVRSGKRGFVRGRGWYSGTSDNILSIAANASGSTRLDVVVLRLTRSTWAVTAAIVQGTPGAGVPAITQDATGGTTGVWEIPLAVVTVANGAATISAGNVADTTWYSHGDRMVLTSTASVQPLATAYVEMRHSDTGNLWESASGVWRRGPWQAAWGVIGGQRYNAGTNLAAGISTTETLGGLSSGSVTLQDNRRYRLHVFIRISVSANDTYFTLRLRETNISGTIVGLWQQLVRGFGADHDWYFATEVATTTGTAKTYVASFQTASNTLTSVAGATSRPVGIWVEDIGPSSPNVLTVI